MRTIAFITILTLLFGCSISQPYDEGAEPIPAFFRNTTTSLKWQPGHTCTATCTRRYVGDWSASDFSLYSKLFLQANKWGWIAPFAEEHNMDCSDAARGGTPSGCLFHNSQNLFPWHRMFTYHFEVMLQQVDKIINPTRTGGPFCLAYMNWGYSNVYYNKNPAKYSFVFGSGSLGTLTAGAIPNSPYKGLKVSGNSVTRQASAGSGEWNNAQLVACFQSTDIECEGDASCGFRPCVEYTAHNAWHNDVGQNFATFYAPSDPLFFFHHAMVDYLFDTWLKQKGTSVQSDYNRQVPRPYDNLNVQLTDTFNTASFCYSYAPAVNKRTKKASMKSRKLSQTSSSKARFGFNTLTGGQKTLVTQIQSQEITPPKARSLQDFKMLNDIKDPKERANTYQQYLKGIDKCSLLYAVVAKKYSTSTSAFTSLTSSLSNQVVSQATSGNQDSKVEDILKSVFF